MLQADKAWEKTKGLRGQLTNLVKAEVKDAVVGDVKGERDCVSRQKPNLNFPFKTERGCFGKTERGAQAHAAFKGKNKAQQALDKAESERDFSVPLVATALTTCAEYTGPLQYVATLPENDLLALALDILFSFYDSENETNCFT